MLLCSRLQELKEGDELLSQLEQEADIIPPELRAVEHFDEVEAEVHLRVSKRVKEGKACGMCLRRSVFFLPPLPPPPGTVCCWPAMR